MTSRDMATTLHIRVQAGTTPWYQPQSQRVLSAPSVFIAHTTGVLGHHVHRFILQMGVIHPKVLAYTPRRPNHLAAPI